MKAKIVKDKQFKTIGFEVTANGRTLFQWGTSPLNTSNYIAEINTNDWLTEIIYLITLRARIDEENNFISRFFEVAKDNKLIKSGQPVNVQSSRDRLKELESKMMNIINNLD